MVGGKGTGSAALLTLVERKSRKLIIRKIKDKTQAAVAAINGIERSMGKEAFKVVFKSITADNGSEFLDYAALETSVFGPMGEPSSITRIPIHPGSGAVMRMPTG